MAQQTKTNKNAWKFNFFNKYINVHEHLSINLLKYNTT